MVVVALTSFFGFFPACTLDSLPARVKKGSFGKIYCDYVCFLCAASVSSAHGKPGSRGVEAAKALIWQCTCQHHDAFVEPSGRLLPLPRLTLLFQGGKPWGRVWK